MFTFSAFVLAANDPPTAPDPVEPGDTASIIVNGVTPGDKFKVYKMIDITYDATTNTVNYSFNEDFEDFFTSKGISKVEIERNKRRCEVIIHSAKPGVFTAHTFKLAFNLFIIRTANASLSTSSEIINNGAFNSTAL